MSSVKDTMKHASIYSAAAMLGKMVGFLMLPFYAHILRGDGYAVIGLLDAGTALLVSMLAFGVRGANIRLYHDQKDPLLKKTVISTGVIIILGISALLVIPIMVFARPIAGLLLDNPDYNKLLIITLITFILEMGGQGASSWLLIQSQSVRFAAINLVKLIIGLGLNIWLILVLDMGLDGYFISALAASVVSNGLLMFIAFRHCGRQFHPTLARQLFAYMLPLIPGNIVGYASRQAERYLVRFQIDLTSVGIMEMGYKFPILIAQFVTTPFMQSWNTRRYEIADDPGADRRIGEMFTFYLLLATFVGLIIAMVIKPLLIILTPVEFHPAYRIAQVEVVTLVFNGTYYHVTFGLFYAKHTRTLALIRGWTAVVKVGLSWLFISSFGLLGAAWSGAIMGVVTVVLGFIYAQRQFKIRMEWKKILLIGVTALGIFFLFNDWDASQTTIYQTIESRWLPYLADGIAASPINNLKDGKLAVMLTQRSAPLTDVIIKGTISVLFGLLIPIMHNRTRWKLLRLLGRQG